MADTQARFHQVHVSDEHTNFLPKARVVPPKQTANPQLELTPAVVAVEVDQHKIASEGAARGLRGSESRGFPGKAGDG